MTLSIFGTAPVPPVDSAMNRWAAEVLGNKGDTVAGNSVVALAKQAIAAGSGGVPVPAPDAVTNLLSRDVTGNKADAAVLTKSNVNSGIAYLKGLLDLDVVPAVDSAANSYLRDVIGNKNDGHTGTSLYAHTEVLLDHIHSVERVYPSLADGIVVQQSAVAWTLGTIVEIVPAGAIASDFDIHYVNLSAISATGRYQLELYEGAADNLICQIRFAKTTNNEPLPPLPTMTPIIAAGSRIRARLAAAVGGVKTVTLSVNYHTY